VKVLVTGGTSLLGSAVARRLDERGDETTVFQRRPSGLGMHEELGDITDASAVAKAMDGAEAVVHLAARVGVVGSWDDFENTNVGGTATVLSAARQAGVSRLVFVSSPSVAHAGESLVGVGAGPADPEGTSGHYARSKAMGERLALGESDDLLSVVAIRPHLVWGPGDTQLIGRIIDRARSGRLATVGSGAALVDTTYIDNAADALVAALDRADRLGGRALVVSNGEPRPIGELVARIVSAAGLDEPSMRVPVSVARFGGRLAERWWELRGRTDDPPMTEFLAEQLSTAHWFAQRETREALDWRPTVSLDEGFARLRRWFEDQPA
jgi:nucleoside-diphosphate-sugar epimerase